MRHYGGRDGIVLVPQTGRTVRQRGKQSGRGGRYLMVAAGMGLEFPEDRAEIADAAHRYIIMAIATFYA